MNLTVRIAQIVMCSIMGIVGAVLFRNWVMAIIDSRKTHASNIAGVIISYKDGGRTVYDLKIKDHDTTIVVTNVGLNYALKVFKPADSILSRLIQIQR